MFLDIGMSILWTVLIIAFVTIEYFTLNLVAIWLAAGALFSLIFALFKFSIISQFAIFIIASGIFLIFTKPFVKKYLKVGLTKTNVDSVIGKNGEVKKEIKSFDTGLVKVGGQMWTAIAYDNEEIELGEKVIVMAVEGVKLIVKRSE